MISFAAIRFPSGCGIPCAAEFLATALFVYVGCGSVCAYMEGEGEGSIVGIALAFGLSITTLAYTIGHHSGGHINPMVTIAMVILKQIDYVKGLLYIVAQLAGACVGAGLLRCTVKDVELENAVNHVGDDITIGGAFVMEMVLSFLLVYVIAETAVNPKSGAGNNAPIAIGLAVFMAHIVAIPYTGTSINPARSFGPALVALDFQDLWLFFVAPITGGVIAAFVAAYIGCYESCEETNDNTPEDVDETITKGQQYVKYDPPKEEEEP